MNSTASRIPRHRGKGFVAHARALGLAFVALSACATQSTTDAPSRRHASFDLILRGGSVLDGTGRPAYHADVGVAGGRITKIGDLSRDTGATVIDVQGLVVAPGFIDIHSHTSALSTAANMLKQGVTTEILNPDGLGPLDIARQLAAVESALAVNVGAYAPFNSAWARVVGTLDRRPTAAEIAQITALLERGLEAGAWGVSAGLDYTPGYYAKTDEVVAALAPLRGWRTNFPNHERLTPETSFSSMAGMRETIEIGERAGLVPVIMHMKLQGWEQGESGRRARHDARSDGPRRVHRGRRLSVYRRSYRPRRVDHSRLGARGWPRRPRAPASRSDCPRADRPRDGGCTCRALGHPSERARARP